jgi:hypothetical protein
MTDDDSYKPPFAGTVTSAESPVSISARSSKAGRGSIASFAFRASRTDRSVNCSRTANSGSERRFPLHAGGLAKAEAQRVQLLREGWTVPVAKHLAD